MSQILLIASVVVVCVCPLATGQASVESVYETTSGRVVGWRESFRLRGSEQVDEVVVVRSVPFAQPPVGPLRFRRPEPFTPPSPSTVVANSTTASASCIQFSPVLPFDVSDAEQSEDCLHLDIYMPTGTAGESKAIMLNIYGGAFVVGTKTVFDGRMLAALGDVIVVTFNYRIGALGFLFTPEEGQDNVALWDQRMALRWISDNARAFGGDPRRITVMGESAGAMSLSQHLLSPTSIDANGEPLFVRAIVQSGAIIDPYVGLSRQAAVQAWHQTSTNAGCDTREGDLLTTDDFLARADFYEGVMQCMRQMDVIELRKRIYTKGITTSPLVENESFLEDPSAETSSTIRTPSSILEQGAFDKRISVMIGWTSDEGALFPYFFAPAPLAMSDALYDGYLGALASALSKSMFTFGNGNESEEADPSASALALKWLYRQERTGYSPSDELLSANATLDEIRNCRRLMDYTGDVLIEMPTVLFAERLSAAGSDVFLYRLDQDGNGSLVDFYPHPYPYDGSSHGDDLSFLFGAILIEGDTPMFRTLPDERFYAEPVLRLSRRLIRLWSNFAKSGKPSEPSDDGPLLQWPQAPALYNFREDESQAPLSDFAAYRPHVVSFWRDFLPKLSERAHVSCDEESFIR